MGTLTIWRYGGIWIPWIQETIGLEAPVVAMQTLGGYVWLWRVYREGHRPYRTTTPQGSQPHRVCGSRTSPGRNTPPQDLEGSRVPGPGMETMEGS